VDTPELDEHYARKAEKLRADAVVLDVGRWGKAPGDYGVKK